MCEYYDNGGIKSIYAQEPVKIKTSIGIIKAEFITFYESGAIKRIFPVYGGTSA